MNQYVLNFTDLLQSRKDYFLELIQLTLVKLEVIAEDLKQVEFKTWIFIALPILYTLWIISFMNNLIYYKLKVLQESVENIQEEHKPFERLDRKNWKIWEIYFCAVFLLPIRMVLVIAAFLPITFFNTFCLLPKNNDKE